MDDDKIDNKFFSELDALFLKYGIPAVHDYDNFGQLLYYMGIKRIRGTDDFIRFTGNEGNEDSNP